MQALQAAIALSETISVDSDTSKIMEAGHSQQRRRKQAKPLRGLDSTGTGHVASFPNAYLASCFVDLSRNDASSRAVNADSRHSC
jgi:hypothetical protein